jgi:hypothetical protein
VFYSTQRNISFFEVNYSLKVGIKNVLLIIGKNLSFTVENPLKNSFYFLSV